MCARFTIRTPADLLAERFGLVQVPDLRLRYNVSPDPGHPGDWDQGRRPGAGAAVRPRYRAPPHPEAHLPAGERERLRRQRIAAAMRGRPRPAHVIEAHA